MTTGVLGAIEILGAINVGKSDQETHKIVNEIVKAIRTQDRQEWPSKELRVHVNQLDKVQKELFTETMEDMLEALDEHYGKINE